MMRMWSAEASRVVSRFASGQFNVGYEARTDLTALRAQRLARAPIERDRRDLDAVLVFRDENVRYLTGLRAQLIPARTTALNGALLITDADPILFCSGGEPARVDATMPWITDVRTIPIIEERPLTEGFVRVLAPVLDAHGLADARLGLDEGNYILVEAICELPPRVRLADGDGPMQLARWTDGDAHVLSRAPFDDALLVD